MKQINMKAKDKIWSMGIPVDLFRRDIAVIITNSREFLMEEIESVLADDLLMEPKYAKEFAEELKEQLKLEDPFPLGLTYEIQSSDSGKGTFVILNGTPKTLSKTVIIHEMYHAMRKICNDRGVDDEETEAYMLEFICSVLFDKIDEWNHKSKKS